MAEQRVNGLGQTVEFNEDSGRWEPVKGETKHVESTETPDETHAQTPTEEETVEGNDETTPRRTWRKNTEE